MIGPGWRTCSMVRARFFTRVWRRAEIWAGAARSRGRIAVTGEIGMVDAEPMVRVEEAGGEQTTYAKVDTTVAKKIVSEHLEKGKKVEGSAVGRVKGQE